MTRFVKHWSNIWQIPPKASEALPQKHCVDEVMKAARLFLNSLKEKSPQLIQPWMRLRRAIPNRLPRSVDLPPVSSPAPEPCGTRQPVFQLWALQQASCASISTGSPPCLRV